jgi:hypothetical protein
VASQVDKVDVGGGGGTLVSVGAWGWPSMSSDTAGMVVSAVVVRRRRDVARMMKVYISAVLRVGFGYYSGSHLTQDGV